MSVYVDQIKIHPSGQWCHMWTDGNIDELHQMAERIGLKRRWFQSVKDHPHYDLRPTKRMLAIELGAIVSSSVLWVKMVRANREQP